MDKNLETIGQVKATLIDLGMRFGPKVLAAIVIVAIGVFVSRWVSRWVDRALRHLELEPPLRLLLDRIARALVLVLFLIMAMENLGVELLPLIAGLGISGALGQYFITEAFRLAPPPVVAPLEYTALAWGMLFDWLLWATAPGLRTLVGAFIIVASGIYVINRERFASAALQQQHCLRGARKTSDTMLSACAKPSDCAPKPSRKWSGASKQ